MALAGMVRGSARVVGVGSVQGVAAGMLAAGTAFAPGRMAVGGMLVADKDMASMGAVGSAGFVEADKPAAVAAAGHIGTPAPANGHPSCHSCIR